MNAVNSQNNEEGSWEAAVSAWVDGESEIRAEELNTPYGRHLWDTYNLIGDVMRSDDLAIQPSDRFYARISAAIDAEPAIVAPISIQNKLSRYLFPSLAVAAVVSMVWIAQPLFFQPDEPVIASATVLAQAPQAELVSAADPENLENSDSAHLFNNSSDMANISEDTSLMDYMAAHQTIAGVGPVHQVAYDLMGGVR